MGFLDKFKKKAPQVVDQVAGLASSQNAKIDAGIEKAASAAKKATGGKLNDKIDTAAGAAESAVDKVAAKKAPAKKAPAKKA